MKLISYLNGGKEQLGILLHDEVFAPGSLQPEIPETMGEFLKNWDYNLSLTRTVEKIIKTSPEFQKAGIPLKAITLLAPVPHPGSLRDGYAFRQHVLTARRNRGMEMIDAFDEFPVFYFGNHRTVTGPGLISCMPDHLSELDYELEVAAVICRPGKNIRAGEADEYIGGLMIMNDFSARKLQMEEMQLSLGPAKGKDFATATGPWLATTDELEPFACPPAPRHVGKCWDLVMNAFVNGKKLSSGRLSDMHWTFAELIERASYGTDLHPGDIIGSGTVGSGCFLELNGSARLLNPLSNPEWLRKGDRTEMAVEGLGILTNNIEKTVDDFSILSLKKKKS